MYRRYKKQVVLVLFIITNVFFIPPVLAVETPSAVTPELYTVVMQKMVADQILAGTDPATLSQDQIQAIATAVAQRATIPRIGNITGTKGQYTVTTGITGIARGVLPVGRYKITLTPLKDFSFVLASDEVTIDKYNATYIGIGIREEKGKRWFGNFISWIQTKLFPKKLRARTPTPITDLDTNTLILQLFNDTNGNGVPDSGEKPVEWANLQVTLTKVSTEELISLVKGTQPIQLKALPLNMHSVMDLLSALYVVTSGDVTISFQQNGVIHSVATRQGKSFGTDAPLDIGISYQVQVMYPGALLIMY